MRKLIAKAAFCAVIAASVCGCIIVRKGANADVPANVLVANQQNVYRTATNIVIKALVQDEKSGEWVDAKYPVLIPAGYYIGSGL